VAKHPHKIFEMHDFRDKAVRAVRSKAARYITEAINSESWNFKFLVASRSASVTHVGFKQAQSTTDDQMSDMQSDFAKLTAKSSIGSKVVLDFTGLNSFSVDSIETLVSFNKNLRHKGSSMVLCCLNSSVRNSFFPAR